MKTYHTVFPLFICHAVCFAKMNIPTELTPIWQGWHEADGCGSYVERCYRRLTVKSCYLNRVACWRGIACRLLRVYARKTEDVKLFNSRERHISSPSSGPGTLNIANINGNRNKQEVFRAFQLFHNVQGVEKASSLKGRGNRPPPHWSTLCLNLHFLSAWKTLSLVFLCFEVLFLSVVCLIKKHLQLFLVQGWKPCHLTTLS